MAISYGLYINFIKKKWFLTIFYTFLIIVVSIESGFRTLMIFLLFPIIVVFMSQGKFIKIGIASIILLLFAKFMLTNRNEINVYYTDLNPLDAAVQTTDLYSETEYVFNNIDRFKSSEQNDFLIYATFLIPRSIFKSKPVPGVVRDYTLMKWGKDILREDGNVFPGIYLNFYLTYGFIGGIIMFISFQYFILYFFVLLYRKYNSVFFLSLYFANLFLNFRSNSPMFYFYIMAPLIILTLTKRNSFKYEIH